MVLVSECNQCSSLFINYFGSGESCSVCKTGVKNFEYCNFCHAEVDLENYQICRHCDQLLCVKCSLCLKCNEKLPKQSKKEERKTKRERKKHIRCQVIGQVGAEKIIALSL